MQHFLVAPRIFTDLKLIREPVGVVVSEQEGELRGAFMNADLAFTYSLQVESVRREGDGFVLAYTHGVDGFSQSCDTRSNDGRGSRTEHHVSYSGRSEVREVALQEP